MLRLGRSYIIIQSKLVGIVEGGHLPVVLVVAMVVACYFEAGAHYVVSVATAWYAIVDKQRLHDIVSCRCTERDVLTGAPEVTVATHPGERISAITTVVLDQTKSADIICVIF